MTVDEYSIIEIERKIQHYTHRAQTAQSKALKIRFKRYVELYKERLTAEQEA